MPPPPSILPGLGANTTLNSIPPPPGFSTGGRLTDLEFTILQAPEYHHFATLYVLPLSPADAREHQDTYITFSTLNSSSDIPGIPPPYAQLHALGKCVYVRGIPARSKKEDVKDSFKNAGCVVRVITVLSLGGSGDDGKSNIFRWVVMGTPSEAEKAIDFFDGFVVGVSDSGGRQVLQVMQAMPPGTTMRFSGEMLHAWQHPQPVKKDNEALAKLHGVDWKVDCSGGFGQLRGLNQDSEALVMPKWVVCHGKGGYAVGEWKLQAPVGTPAGIGFKQDKTMKSQDHTVSAVELEDEAAESSPWSRSLLESTPRPDRNATPRATASKASTQTHTRTQTPVVAVPDMQHIRSQSTTSSTSMKTDDNPTPRPPAAAPGSSWANIASSSNPETKIINLQPTSRIESLAPRLRPNNGDNVASIQNPTLSYNPEDPSGRLVFIMDIPNNLTLHEVSNAIVEGPLARIQFGIGSQDGKRFVGIVFQHAWHAETFYSVLLEEARLSRPGRFRFVTDSVLSDYGRDEFIDAVDEGCTRRLTIVKAKFFFMLTKDQLQAYVEKLVGAEAVQLVWPYNGGNATVVFADVLSAIKVKADFDRRAEEGRGMWESVVTTFSKDPCQVPLGELSTTLAE